MCRSGCIFFLLRPFAILILWNTRTMLPIFISLCVFLNLRLSVAYSGRTAGFYFRPLPCKPLPNRKCGSMSDQPYWQQLS